MKWRSAWIVVALGLVLAGGAAAQQDATEVEIIVAHISDEPGEIDPRGRELHEKLKDEFRYQSLRVLELRRLKLAADQLGSVGLPNGKQARVRPLQRDARSVLLAVEIEGAVRTDVRANKGRLVVFGAQRYDGAEFQIAEKYNDDLLVDYGNHIDDPEEIERIQGRWHEIDEELKLDDAIGSGLETKRVQREALRRTVQVPNAQ